MKREYQKGEVLATATEVFIGIDVHKESWQVEVVLIAENADHFF